MGRGRDTLRRMTFAARIEALTAALPADERARVEADLLAWAERAAALHREGEARLAAAREGLAALERGDVVPAEEAFDRLREGAAERSSGRTRRGTA